MRRTAKDESARADMMAASDITILCLPDAAAIDAARLAIRHQKPD